MSGISLRALLKSHAHMGLSNSVWHPAMSVYIHSRVKGTGMHVIDLVETCRILKSACEYVQKVSREGGSILFVGTRAQASDIIAREAQRCNSNYIQHRWLGGLLTNWAITRERIETLISLDTMIDAINAGEATQLPKKEVRVLRREHYKLNQNIGGLRKLTQLPTVAIVVDPVRERTAVRELRKKGIPIISISDTNADPRLSNFPLVANVYAKEPIRIILSELADSIIRAGRAGDL